MNEITDQDGLSYDGRGGSPNALANSPGAGHRGDLASLRKLKNRYSFKSQTSRDDNINFQNQNPDDNALRVSFNQEMMQKLNPNMHVTAVAAENTETSETIGPGSGSVADLKS
jgi:hypothetical protein